MNIDWSRLEAVLSYKEVRKSIETCNFLVKFLSSSVNQGCTRGNLVTSAQTNMARQNMPHTAIVTWNLTDDPLRSAENRREAKIKTLEFISSLPFR